MCGICGILNHNGKPVNRSDLTKMNNSMALRGPDDSGFYHKGRFGMAMRRLSIIDLSGGHQPITNEDGTIHLILNGEIYNYIELRHDLEKLGHQFRTNSDVEVLIHLYEEYEFKAIEYLNGMFAFALWDENKQRLWMGRDRLGIKPLLYYSTKDQFSFASTVDALVGQDGFKKEVDEESILLFMALSYVPTPRTIWKNIRKLPPAHWMLVENGKTVTECYWKIEKSDLSICHDEFVEETKFILHDSIKLHGRSDVDVGTFLSGGLDSSAVTALFALHSDHVVKTFSMDFEGKAENEGHFAKIISDRYGTRHYAYSLGAEEAVDTLDHLLGIMDEPMADSAIVPSYLLSKRARDSGIKVMLSGAGGDELFGGYHRHYSSKHDTIAGIFKWFPQFIKNIIPSTVPSRLQQYAFLASNSKGLSFGINTSGVNLGVLNKLILGNRKFEQTLDLLNQQFRELPELERMWGFSYSRMMLDLNHYLVDNVLPITDKTSMANSVEARVPLLDHRLVELAFSVSPEQNISETFCNAKRSLKSAVRNNLPESILSISKIGFNGPVNYWIKHLSSKFTTDFLCEYIDPKMVTEISGQPNNYNNTAENIFTLYVLNSWLQKHL